MTSYELISRVKQLKASPFSDDALLGFINELEAKLQRNIVMIKNRATLLLDGESRATLPDGVVFEDIVSATLDGQPIEAVDSFELKGYMQGFDATVRVIGISGHRLDIVYKSAPPVHTADNCDVDSLLLPDSAADIYIYYICAQIDLYSADLAGFNNFVVLYNAALSQYTGGLYDNPKCKVAVRFNESSVAL